MLLIFERIERVFWKCWTCLLCLAKCWKIILKEFWEWHIIHYENINDNLSNHPHWSDISGQKIPLVVSTAISVKNCSRQQVPTAFHVITMCTFLPLLSAAFAVDAVDYFFPCISCDTMSRLINKRCILCTCHTFCMQWPTQGTDPTQLDTFTY